MSIEAVRQFLAAHAPELAITEHSLSTATVPQAAEAFGVAEAQIAKTLALRVKGQTLLLVAAGNARLDNKKCKAVFGASPRMLPPDEVFALTGHAVGGVCPFALNTPMTTYCDISLQQNKIIYPAAGSANSGIRITPEHLATLVDAAWVDVCST